jgi:hypothetical protein
MALGQWPDEAPGPVLTAEGTVIRPQPGPQQRFLRSRADIAI